MKRFKKSVTMLIILLFGLSTISLTGCGWKPSEEDIKQLEETKSAALAAEKKLQETKAEREDLEKKVEAKKAELEKLETDRDKVEQFGETDMPTRGE